jgi:hypothetical protein
LVRVVRLPPVLEARLIPMLVRRLWILMLAVRRLVEAPLLREVPLLAEGLRIRMLEPHLQPEERPRPEAHPLLEELLRPEARPRAVVHPPLVAPLLRPALPQLAARQLALEHQLQEARLRPGESLLAV